MNIKELHKFFKNEVTKLYKVEDGKVKEYKVEPNRKKKGELSIWQLEDDNTFGVSFSKPEGWKPDYALPVIFVEDYDEKTQKVKVEEPKHRGGWDVPGSYFWVDGDFFLTEDAANDFIKK